MEENGVEWTDNIHTVVGVKATGENNTPVILHANRGVVIATGGFAANTEMRQKYDSTLIESLPTTNTPAAQGDGITMAETVDASVIGMEYIQSLPFGDPADGALSGWVGSGVETFYLVNKEGERFMAEDGRRDTMTAALLAQTDAYAYVITGYDENHKDFITSINYWGDVIDELVETGRVFRADTIQELA